MHDVTFANGGNKTMKTKQELLEKYKNNKEFYEVINAHYGTKTAL